jgi:hypothetical protein
MPRNTLNVLTDRLWGPHSRLSARIGYRWPFPVKRQEREADHSPRTNAQVKKTWNYTFTPHTPSWHIGSLVKHRDNFAFTSVKLDRAVYGMNIDLRLFGIMIQGREC